MARKPQEQKERDLIADSVIDKNGIEEGLIEQPECFRHWGMKWAKAVALRENKKNRLALARSKAEFEVRADPEIFQLTKVTEASVKAAVDQHEDVEKAMNEYLEAKEDADVMLIAKDTMMQRRDSLWKLTDIQVTSLLSSGGPGKDRLPAKVARKKQRDALNKA